MSSQCSVNVSDQSANVHLHVGELGDAIFVRACDEEEILRSAI